MRNAALVAVVTSLSIGLLGSGCETQASEDAATTPRRDAFAEERDAPAQPDAFGAEDAFGRDDAFSAEDAFGADAFDLPDAFSSTDAGGTVDAFSPDAAVRPPCGGMRPDISRVRDTEGLVIGRDGAVYYSQRRAIGRIAVDGTVNDSFAMLPSRAAQVWGIVPDAANEHLYVGSPSTGTVYDIDLRTSPPTVTTLVADVGGPNGLTLGPDGALYFSDFIGGRVMRVALGASEPPTVVARVANANGIAFDDAGRLLVCDYGAGELLRLTLRSGVETARETVANRLGNPDGVALDRDGTIYVTDNGRGRLLRFEADGTTTALLSGVGSAASLDFGAGALDCEDIYVASSGAMRRYEMGTIPGRAVPWH
jgi:hypothetical protein